MSYINEALKKAQKEKDFRNIRLIRNLEAGGKRKKSKKDIVLYLLLLLIFLFLLVFIGVSWLDLSDKKEIEPRPSSTVVVNVPEEKPDSELIYNKAGDLFKTGMADDAESHYKKVLELDPGHVDTLNNLGVIYLHKGDYESAASCFEKAIRLRPDFADPYYNMACLHSIKSEAEKGIIYLKKAFDLNSDVIKWALNDSDLKNIRSLPEFREIFTR